MSEPLVNWQIGLDAAGAIEKLEGVAKKADEASDKVNELKKAAQGAVSDLRAVALGSVALGTALVRSHAIAGFAGTSQGQQAQAYGQLFNRQIAAIFAPLLEEKTKYVNQMTQWLGSLNGSQRESIRTLGAFTLAMTATGFIIPRVTRALHVLAMSANLASAANQKAAALSAAEKAGKHGDLGGKIGGYIALGLSLAAATPKGREGLAEMAKAFAPLLEHLGDLVKAIAPVLGSLAKLNAKVITWLRERIPEALTRPGSQAGSGFVAGRNAGSFLRHLFGIDDAWKPATLGGGDSSSSSNLSMAGQGFEGIEDAYDRINAAASKMDLEQQQVSLLRKIEENTRPSVAEAAAFQSPAVSW
jgi:hypothetical protein